MWDIVSGGRQAVARLADWLGDQERALDNARRASTEVSRRRVERDEVTIYLDGLHAGPSAPAAGADEAESAEGAEGWPGTSAQAAD